jgi:4-hydroxythreonine-4-phosphate dehydrogenase
MSPRRIVLGLTLGDPAGIGPEIARSAASSALPDGVSLRMIGTVPEGTRPGHPTPATAAAAIAALEQSVELLRAGEIHGVVTGPVSKAALHAAGFAFPGQSEFYAERFGTTDWAMILTGGGLTVSLATIHIPLAEVARRLTPETIVRAGRHLHALQTRRLQRPVRLAVAGLNPHAGESGRFGEEEARIIAPALAELESLAPGVFSGPHPPDTVFRRSARGEFDGVVCMYHDQGLIPLKLIGFDSGVNITAGLPVVRTSPDHGTAFDIAGTGTADASSLLAAIRVAAELASGS